MQRVATPCPSVSNTVSYSARYAVSCFRTLWLSPKRRLYHHPCLTHGAHHSPRQSLARHLVVERSAIRSFAADCPLRRCLGFNHAPYTRFFLLSSPSRLSLFHDYVVARVPLGVPSNSMGCIFRTDYSERGLFVDDYALLHKTIVTSNTKSSPCGAYHSA